jgi:hypothetical protein
MVKINKYGYLERSTKSGKSSNGTPTIRNWWLVKSGSLPINKITIGKEYDGKRIKVKIILEEIENEKIENNTL